MTVLRNASVRSLLAIGVPVVIILASCTVIAFHLLASPHEASSGFSEPLVEVPVHGDQTSAFDFGVIRRGSTVSGTIVIWNNGPSEVRIEDVNGTCGCMATAITDRELPSGRRCRVMFTLTSSATDDSTHIQKALDIVFAGDGLSPRKVNVVAKVTTGVEIDPKALRFDQLASTKYVKIRRTTMEADEFRRVFIHGGDLVDVAEVSRNDAEVVYKVAWYGHQERKTSIPPLQVRTIADQESGSESSVIDRITCSIESVLSPQSFVVVVDGDADRLSLKSKTNTLFQFRRTRNRHARVTHVGVDRNWHGVIGWEICEDTDIADDNDVSPLINVFLREVPDKGLHSGEIHVGLLDSSLPGTGASGRPDVFIPFRVIVK